MCERYMDWLPLTYPQAGTWPASQACALTGNQTIDLFVCRPAFNPLSHTSMAVSCILYLVSSSINVPTFHIIWLDTFWTVHIYDWSYL